MYMDDVFRAVTKPIMGSRKMGISDVTGMGTASVTQ
jgi:hypothetical protein